MSVGFLSLRVLWLVRRCSIERVGLRAHSTRADQGLLQWNGSEMMMSNAFENMVMRLVQDSVPSNEFSAEFFNGTLFLHVTEDNARSVFHKLTEYCQLGRVQISKVTHGEYAYDFV